MLPLIYGPFNKLNTVKPLRELGVDEVSSCIDAVIDNGGVALAKGWAKLKDSDLASEVKLIKEHLNTNGTRFICIHTKTKFWVYDPSADTLTDYTQGAAYTSSEYWSSCSYGNIYIFTNGTDNVQQWAATGVLADATDLTNAPDCRIVRTFGAYLLCFAIVDAGDITRLREIRWCASGDPTNWTTLDSGFETVYEGEGAITNAHILTRDTIAVYKEKSTHTLAFVGAPYYFVITNTVAKVGLRVRREGVAALGDSTHAVMSTEGLCVYDGVAYRQVAEEIKDVYDQLANTPYIEGAVVAYDQTQRRLFVGFPDLGSVKIIYVLVYSFKDKSWYLMSGLSLYAIGMATLAEATTTWDSYPDTVTWDSMNRWWDSVQERPYVLFADANYVYRESDVYTRNGVAYTGKFEVGLRNPGAELYQAPLKKCETMEIHIDMEGGTPSVEIGTAEHAGGPIAWSAPQTPDSEGKVYYTVVGRWFGFRFSSSSYFRVTGFACYFNKRGHL